MRSASWLTSSARCIAIVQQFISHACVGSIRARLQISCRRTVLAMEHFCLVVHHAIANHGVPHRIVATAITGGVVDAQTRLDVVEVHVEPERCVILAYRKRLHLSAPRNKLVIPVDRGHAIENPRVPMLLTMVGDHILEHAHRVVHVARSRYEVALVRMLAG